MNQKTTILVIQNDACEPKKKKREFKEEIPISKCYENKNGYSMQILKKMQLYEKFQSRITIT